MLWQWNDNFYKLLLIYLFNFKGRTASKAYSIDVIRNCFGATEIRDNHKKTTKCEDSDDDYETPKNPEGEEFHWYQNFIKITVSLVFQWLILWINAFSVLYSWGEMNFILKF